MKPPDRESTESKRRRANDGLDELSRLLRRALDRTDNLVNDGDDRDR